MTSQRLKKLPPLNIYKRLAEIDDVLVPWTDMVSAIYNFKVDPKLREIAICRQSGHTQSAYEFHHHKNLALKAGVMDKQLKQIYSLMRPQSIVPYDQDIVLICTFVDEIEGTENHRASPLTLKYMRRIYGKDTTDELLIIVAFYSAVGIVTNTWRLKPERAIRLSTDPLTK